MSNSVHRKADIADMRVYALEDAEVSSLAEDAWGIELVRVCIRRGAYYSVNFDYFVDKDEPDLGGHVLAPWWRKQ